MANGSISAHISFQLTLVLHKEYILPFPVIQHRQRTPVSSSSYLYAESHLTNKQVSIRLVLGYWNLPVLTPSYNFRHLIDGNPAGSTLPVEVIIRQKDIYGRVPRTSSFDGGFAPHGNNDEIEILGVKDVCFSKKRGMKIKDMCRSRYVYRCLLRFRAGIESINHLLAEKMLWSYPLYMEIA